LNLFTRDSAIKRAVTDYYIVRELCEADPGMRVVEGLLTAGMGNAFGNTVIQFSEQGKSDRELENIRSRFSSDQGGCAEIGSDELGWTQFTAGELLSVYGRAKDALYSQ
jgi:hypothetical protein